MYGAESEDVIIPEYDRIYSLKDYIPGMMKEIRKDNEEKVILILDWNFFDYFRYKEDVSDSEMFSNVMNCLKEHDSLLLSSEDRERSNKEITEWEQEYKQEAVNVEIYEEGRYYIDPEMFTEQDHSSDPEILD